MKLHERIDDRLREFVERQQVFFVRRRRSPQTGMSTAPAAS